MDTNSIRICAALAYISASLGFALGLNGWCTECKYVIAPEMMAGFTWPLWLPAVIAYKIVAKP